MRVASLLLTSAVLFLLVVGALQVAHCLSEGGVPVFGALGPVCANPNIVIR